MFLKEVSASRKMDGNISPPDDVTEDKRRSTEHTEEERVTDPFISTDESQVQRNKGHYKFKDPAQTNKRRQFVRKGTSVMKQKGINNEMISLEEEKLNVYKRNFFQIQVSLF